MASVKPFLLLALVPLAMSQYVYEEPLLYDTFPDDFLWGVATSAYQVEFRGISHRIDYLQVAFDWEIYRLKEVMARTGSR